MTDPISAERLAVTREEAISLLEGACRNWLHVPKLSEEDIGDVATELLRFVNSRRQSPAGVEPVSDLIRQALHELDNVTALNDQDANCLGCAENLLRQALAPSPPKSATITDDLLAALMEARDALNGAPNTVGLHHQIDAAITAALSNEAHNG